MSENSFLADTIQQRNSYAPTPVVIRNGVVNFPPGTVINALQTTFNAPATTFTNSFLDSSLNENIPQGTTLTNPNSVDTNTRRSFIVASENSSLTDDYCCAVIASSNGDLLTSAVPTPFNMSQEAIIAARDCIHTNSRTSTTNPSYANAIIASRNHTVSENSAATGAIYSNATIASDGGFLFNLGSSSGGIGRVLNASSATSTISNSGAGLVGDVTILSGISNTVSNTSAKRVDGVGIYNSSGASVTGSVQGEIITSAIMSSNTCTVTNSTANASAVPLKQVLIAASTTSNINNASTAGGNGQSECAIIACDSAAIPSNAPAGGYTHNCAVIGCKSIFLSGNYTGGEYRSCAVIACEGNTMGGSGTGVNTCTYSLGSFTSPVNYTNPSNNNCNGTIGCRNTAMAFNSGTGSASVCNTAIGSTAGNMAQNGTNSYNSNTLISTSTANMTNSGAFLLENNVVMASYTPTLRANASTCGSSVLAASTTGTILSSQNSFATGSSPNINSFNNVLAVSATATSNLQSIFGTRVDVTGAGNNVTVGGGYIQSSNGYTATLRSPTFPATLLAADNLLLLLGSTGTLTIPQASSIGASFPTGASKSYQISGGASGIIITIALSGADTFRNKTNWTTHTLSNTGAVLELILVNTASTPFWTLLDSIQYDAQFLMGTANNFGVSPPKSDASQLPTSTSEANHYTLTTSSYVTFTTTSQTDHIPAYTISGQGITFNISGLYKINYSVVVRTNTGVLTYIIRSDLANTSTGATVLNSYAENGGENITSGVRTISGKAGKVFATNGTSYTVRLSQDSANLINASASIVYVRFNVCGYV